MTRKSLLAAQTAPVLASAFEAMLRILYIVNVRPPRPTRAWR